ncbi:MAG: hypothetical protein AAF627_11930 [Myxococcota bacterium]
MMIPTDFSGNRVRNQTSVIQLESQDFPWRGGAEMMSPSGVGVGVGHVLSDVGDVGPELELARLDVGAQKVGAQEPGVAFTS